ncbi:MAG: dihydrolipoyl dehydrogenase [Armatimonadetes bacterium]|nr:dihydrolipoyl dehydrogenase [Armatimonadota bacterium]
MANEQFDADIIVIGAGPGGYYAAIRAAQMGASVICVEKEYLGGTCLNVGCVPSKAMIASVEMLNKAKKAESFGLKKIDKAEMDFDAFMKRKEKIVLAERGGVGMLFKKRGVKHVEGFAKFIDANTISVTAKDGTESKYRGKNFILATGSSVVHLPVPGLEGGREDGVWTSDDAVSAPFVPDSMVVLGGGAVGCEFSYVFNGLGSKVTLVEMMPTLVNIMDEDLGVELGKQLSRQGIDVRTGATIDKVEKTKKGWKAHIKKGTETEVIETQVVLLGVGRKANIEGMNLEGIGVKLHRRGVEIVDDTLRTHVPNIYAIGDVTGRIQLAHVAQQEGLAAVNNILKPDSPKTVDYRHVPNVVYTSPEVASVGMSESEAKSKGYDVVVGRSRFAIFAKAMAANETEGFVKVVAEKKYGEVLGLHMVGGHVSDLLHEGVVALVHEATLESMETVIHAHPTMAEAIIEAFEDAAGHAIHKM